MSYAIIDVIYGIPLNEEVAQKLKEWEENGDERWTDGNGFTQLYSAGGSYPFGYCGVKIDTLEHYTPQLVSSLKKPTGEQKAKAVKLCKQVEPELRELAGPIGLYFIWSDA